MSTIYLVPNAHIDPIWLWRWSEGQQVIRKTFYQAVCLLQTEKDLIFFASSAIFYKVVEETDPKLFDAIKKLVREGRWVIVGGWWVEPDCNLPSGESFARHSLYGQKYFQEKFGKKASIGYNIDSFGHNAMMPQILVNSGMDSYIFMRPNPKEKSLPYWTFRWRSQDGSEVIANRIIGSYNARGKDLHNFINSIIKEIKSPLNSVLFFVGEGDHGSGLTSQDVKIIEDIKSELKNVELKYAQLTDFFVASKKLEDKLPLVEEELQHHASGCYSSLSKVKELNRSIEEALISSEKLYFIANFVKVTKSFKEELYKAWTNLLFCQFHDVLAGTCLKEAYENDVYPNLYESLSIANNVTEFSIRTIASTIDISEEKEIVVFNQHTFPVKVFVELNWVWDKNPSFLEGNNGKRILCQNESTSMLVKGTSKLVFLVDLPPLGYCVYVPKFVEYVEKTKNELSVGEFFIENNKLKIEINNKDGTISIFVKDTNGFIITEDSAKIQILDDQSDTWGHGVLTFDKIIGQANIINLKITEKGPVRATLRVKYHFGNSDITQDFILYKDLDYLISKVTIDWHEKSKMLKIRFPINVSYPSVNYEIPYGMVRRQTDGKEEPGLRWVDITGNVSNGEICGMTLVNNSKYSYDVKDNVLGLTVLRSPPFAHHDPEIINKQMDYEYIDQGYQVLTYALKPHRGKFRPCDAVKLSEIICNSTNAIIEHKHEGTLPKTISLVSVSKENIILKVLKESENEDGWITRLYETIGALTKCLTL